MMPILMVLLLIGEAVFAVACLYLLALTLVGFLYRPKPAQGLKPISRFAILVPAHNEEFLLPSLMKSLQGLEYPRELYDVYVVADNCSDRTAHIARGYGAVVLERQDSQLIGKGHALRWLLSRIRSQGENYDAYVFVDADTEVSSNFLEVMEREFQAGNSVVQAHYAVSNPTQTSVSALRFIAFELMNYVRPLGRRVLGLSSGLFGTGMGFKATIVDSHGWDAFSLAEDVEYFMKLTDRGVRVAFAPEAKVWTRMPPSFRESEGQNLRWERGRLLMAWKFSFRFLLQGLFSANPVKIDAAIQQLVPPLSVVCTATAGLLVLSLLSGQAWAIGLGLVANLGLLGHILLGMRTARVPLRAYRAFALAPWFMAWKVGVYARALLPREMRWTRTERP